MYNTAVAVQFQYLCLLPIIIQTLVQTLHNIIMQYNTLNLVLDTFHFYRIFFTTKLKLFTHSYIHV